MPWGANIIFACKLCTDSQVANYVLRFYVWVLIYCLFSKFFTSQVPFYVSQFSTSFSKFSLEDKEPIIYFHTLQKFYHCLSCSVNAIFCLLSWTNHQMELSAALHYHLQPSDNPGRFLPWNASPFLDETQHNGLSSAWPIISTVYLFSHDETEPGRIYVHEFFVYIIVWHETPTVHSFCCPHSHSFTLLTLLASHPSTCHCILLFFVTIHVAAFRPLPQPLFHWGRVGDGSRGEECHATQRWRRGGTWQ